jgi:hypothetical protein
MHRLVVQSRVGSDGVLHIDIPIGKEAADSVVQVTIDPVRVAPAPMSQEEWKQFIMDTAGSITDPAFMRDEQGEYEHRDELP